ncbi:MAG: hypothetical protein JSU06_19760 [Actinobacteria bacterium]|nr:hypothetical protein [Actinomycetota bacterium]
MLRRSSPLALALALAALLVAATAAPAAITHRTEWDMSIAGKQIVTWSFAAERPEHCVSYYGEASAEATGHGRVGLTFATPKKKPLEAETYLRNGKLRFFSFSTDGWSIPAAWSKRGTFSLSYGMPCGSRADDPVPLPTISDDSGCGTKKLDFNPVFSWSGGELTVLGTLSPVPYVACPGVFEPAAQVDSEAPCTPKGDASGLDGTQLQELHPAAASDDFTAGKPFDVVASHKFLCEFPSLTWPENPPLKVALTTRYEVSFEPRRP